MMKKQKTPDELKEELKDLAQLLCESNSRSEKRKTCFNLIMTFVWACPIFYFFFIKPDSFVISNTFKVWYGPLLCILTFLLCALYGCFLHMAVLLTYSKYIHRVNEDHDFIERRKKEYKDLAELLDELLISKSELEKSHEESEFKSEDK